MQFFCFGVIALCSIIVAFAHGHTWLSVVHPTGISVHVPVFLHVFVHFRGHSPIWSLVPSAVRASAFWSKSSVRIAVMIVIPSFWIIFILFQHFHNIIVFFCFFHCLYDFKIFIKASNVLSNFCPIFQIIQILSFKILNSD